MADFNITNRAKTIRIATLSGLYPMQCRKSGSIMFSNGVQCVFIPEGRNFSHDEEVANIVSLCNANGLNEESAKKYVEGLRNNNQNEVYGELSKEIISKFSKESETKRHNRSNFVEGVAYTQKYTDILKNAGINENEAQSIVSMLFEDAKTINVGAQELSGEERVNQ